MGADYTLWKPETQEKFLLGTGQWNEILDLPDCTLTKLKTQKHYIVSKMRYYEFDDIDKKAQALIDFCGQGEIVLTNDCGKEYFNELDVYNGIKDKFKIIGDITEQWN